MNQDPFKILGISENATEEEAKKAHRRLAKKYHPDLNPEIESNQKMVEINMAFDEVMSILENRKEYYGTEDYSHDDCEDNGNYYNEDLDDENDEDDVRSSDYYEEAEQARQRQGKSQHAQTNTERAYNYYEAYSSSNKSRQSGSSDKSDDRINNTSKAHDEKQRTSTWKHFRVVLCIILGVLAIACIVYFIIPLLSNNTDTVSQRVSTSTITATPSPKLPTSTPKPTASVTQSPSTSNSGGFWGTIGSWIGALFKFLWSALLWLLGILWKIIVFLWNAITGIIGGIFHAIFG